MKPEGSLPHSQVPATCPYHEPARSSPHTHISLPEDLSLFRLNQGSVQAPRLTLWVFRNVMLFFLRRGVLSTSPNPQAGGPLLVGCPRLIIQYIRSCPPYWRPFLHPQPEDAPCRGDRDRLITAFCLAWPSKIGPMCFPEMSLTNYQCTLHNIPEERRSHFYYSGSLKSRSESYAAYLTGWGTKWSWPASQYYHHNSRYVKKCLCNLHFSQSLRKNTGMLISP